MQQQIRFCKSFDGTRIAYATSGEGPPLVKAPHWLTHLEYEQKSEIWRPWLAGLARGRTLVRMDERGCGLADRGVAEISFEAFVRDLEAVVDAAGLERFALFGHSQGGAISIEYAARHPERVTHLVLLGTYARGRYKREPERHAEFEAQLKLVEVGWGRDDASYRQLFASQFMPGATLEQLRLMCELQRVSSHASDAVRLMRATHELDVSASLPRVSCPTLVLHARGDLRVSYEEGRLLAARIPDARFVLLESNNHILLEQEPAFAQVFQELEAFLPGAAQTIEGLTAREAQILEHIAQGLDNAQIAARLELSEKTVRNHITSVFDKIGVESRAQAIVLARERGLGQRSRSS
ncbi:MAG TPA: alpha/beta fold hydrolase [Burkholderiales bacterium]|nr:alpha/beta fold hydrolase [Burkholderiales bacterium]